MPEWSDQDVLTSHPKVRSLSARMSRGRTKLGTYGSILLVVSAFEGSACAMRPAAQTAVECTVENADKLPAELRQAEAVCGPIRRAVQEVAASRPALAPISVRVVVESAYKIAVTAGVNGVALPVQKLGSADRPLTVKSMERLASAVAAQLASSAQRDDGQREGS